MKSSLQFWMGGLQLAAVLTPASAGTRSDYDVTTDTQVFHLRGDSVVGAWATVQPREYPIVVRDKVRTGSDYSGNAGHEYALGGACTGTAYAATVPGMHHDGASDGSHNYTTSHWSNERGALGRTVWRTASDWTAPVKLFDTVSTRPSGIAFDPRDGTLWMSGYSNAGYFYQYATSGSLLGSTDYPVLAGLRTLGGEMPAVPEPGAFAQMLGGLTLLGLGRLRLCA